MGLFRAVAKFFGAIKIVKGIVIQKGDEHFGGEKAELMQVGKKVASVGITVPESETFTLKVKGVDSKGRELTEDFTVDELTYNTTKVGDAWPIT
jgi:hypothetical protein